MDNEWWQITDFATHITDKLKESTGDNKASVHYNTVDKWFKAMETKRVHYITRANGEKIYNKLDLLIGLFIAEKRKDNKFRLDVIYDLLPDYLEVRPFPDEFEDETSLSIDESQLEKRMIEKMNKFLGQHLEIQQEQQRIANEKLISESLERLLPPPVNKEEERAIRFNDNMTRIHIENKLKKQAISEWNKKPAEERMKKAGWFRTEEDLLKRATFIDEYVMKHIEQALREEYQIT